LANYIFIDESGSFNQYKEAFNISQVWVNKVFHLGRFVFRNEIAFQQKTGTAPVNIPAFMGRNQVSYERYVFGNALKIATGIDLRWHTDYSPAGYSPFYNRYFYQTAYKT